MQSVDHKLSNIIMQIHHKMNMRIGWEAVTVIVHSCLSFPPILWTSVKMLPPLLCGRQHFLPRLFPTHASPHLFSGAGRRACLSPRLSSMPGRAFSSQCLFFSYSKPSRIVFSSCCHANIMIMSLQLHKPLRSDLQPSLVPTPCSHLHSTALWHSICRRLFEVPGRHCRMDESAWIKGHTHTHIHPSIHPSYNTPNGE